MSTGYVSSSIFNGKRHPNETGKQAIERHLIHLALRDNVSSNTQTGVLNVIAFLYRTVFTAGIN